jgi:WWE domain
LEKNFQEKTNIFDVTINNIVYTINFNTMSQAQKNDNTKCRRIRRATEDEMALSAPQSSPGTTPRAMHSLNLIPPTDNESIENETEDEYSDDDDDQWETETGSEEDAYEYDEEYDVTKSKAPIIVPISIPSSSVAIDSQNQETKPKPLLEVNFSPHPTTTPYALSPFDACQKSPAEINTFFINLKPVMEYNIEVLNISVSDAAVISVIFSELFLLNNMPIIAAALAIVIWILYQYYKR